MKKMTGGKFNTEILQETIIFLEHSVTSETTGKLQKGDRVNVLMASEGFSWIQIETLTGKKGWVYGTFRRSTNSGLKYELLPEPLHFLRTSLRIGIIHQEKVNHTIDYPLWSLYSSIEKWYCVRKPPFYISICRPALGAAWKW